jgi:iron complex outermembrane receptor protein
MNIRNSVLFCTAAIAVLGTASGAAAQAAAGGGAQVQEIIVTAQRRAERLEEVPASVSVVTPQAIERAGITSFMDLGQITPGTQMNFGGSVPHVTTRGVGTTVAGYSIETNSAIYIDGFYDPQPLTIQSDIANLQSIQVLKGPQGTLYGRNATGGAILINTLGPTRTFTGKADVSYGNYNDGIANAYVAGPFSEQVRGSLSAHYQHGDTTMRKASPITPGESVGPAAHFEEVGVRGKLEADLTSTLQATLGLNYSYHNDPRANFYPNIGHILPIAAPPVIPAAFGQAAFFGKPIDYAYQDEGTLKLAWTTPIGVLTSYTGYAFRRFGLNFQFDDSYLISPTKPLSYTIIRYHEKTFQQAFDYVITAIPRVDLNVGGMYFHDNFGSPGSIGAPDNYSAGNLATSAHVHQHSTSWALYADGTYHVTDKLSLNAGGRFSHDHRSFEYDVQSPTGAYLQIPASDAASWSKFTPRVTARYEVAPRANVYLSWSKGYREGAYSPAGSICTAPGPGQTCILKPDPPETITSYEAGFKAAWSRVRFETAVFHYDWKNVQMAGVGPNPFNPLLLSTFLQSVPQIKITGVDVELTATPTDHLEVHANFEYLHSRFGRYPNASGTGVDANNRFNIGGQLQDWSGLTPPASPTWTGNLGFDYTQPLSYGGTVVVSSNLHFTDDYAISNSDVYGPLAPPELQHVQRFIQKGYALLSAQVMWTDPTGHYSVMAYGTNLTNKIYKASYNGTALGDFAVRADPREYGVRLAYKW